MSGDINVPVIRSLQVGRGLAALAVTAHHAALSTNAFVGVLPDALMKVFDLGAFGVDFFFVLSGFIIMHTHSHELGRPDRIKGYLFKRLTRIYPVYWPIGLSLVGLYLMLPNLSASGGREFSLMSSLLLLPSGFQPALSVAWTLVHELIFYGFFVLWFISIRYFSWGLVIWATLILAAHINDMSTGWISYPLGLLNFEFMLGILAALVYRRGYLAHYGSVLTFWGFLTTCVALLLLYYGMPDGETRLILAAGVSLLVLGLAIVEQKSSINYPEMMLALGNASYSIYLVHNPILSVTQRLAGSFVENWLLAWIFGTAIALMFGFIYHLMFERPILRYFRSAKFSA